MMIDMFSVQVVIVNYRTADLVMDCLRSLVSEIETVSDCRVIVVDGGSGDGSAERLANAIQTEGWHDWVELLALAENCGFAAGNNAAIRPLLDRPNPPEYVLLLNPDTIVRPGAIRELVQFLEANPKVGIAGSRLEDPDGTPQCSAFRFPTVASEFESGMRLGLVSKLLRNRLVAPPIQYQNHRTDWVSGASLMVRRDVFESIGLLDDAYFLYFEETEFCFRAIRAGRECWYVPASRVVHLVGQSTGMNDVDRLTRRVPRYWLESRRRYFTNCYGPGYRMACDVAWAVGFAIWRIRRRFQGKPDRDPPQLLRDFVAYSLWPNP